jgi:hypothetical protein
MMINHDWSTVHGHECDERTKGTAALNGVARAVDDPLTVP